MKFHNTPEEREMMQRYIGENQPDTSDKEFNDEFRKWITDAVRILDDKFHGIATWANDVEAARRAASLKKNLHDQMYTEFCLALTVLEARHTRLNISKDLNIGDYETVAAELREQRRTVQRLFLNAIEGNYF